MLSKLPVELIGWQLPRWEAVVDNEDIARIEEYKNRLSDFAISSNSRAREAYKVQTGEDGISLPDPVAMSIALDPTIGTAWSSHSVEVETHSELTRGMTVVDRLGVAGDERNRTTWSAAVSGQAKICWSIDIGRWKQALFKALE